MTRAEDAPLLTSASPVWAGALTAATDLIAVLDPEFRLVAFNPSYAEASHKMLQCPVQTGLPLLAALAHLPEHQAQARRLWSRALQGEVFTEMVAIQPETKEAVRVWEVSFYPLYDDQQQVLAAVHIAREVTARVEREEQTLFALEWERMERSYTLAHGNQLGSEQEELHRQWEHLRSLIALASHDLREPMRTVSAYTQLLQRHYGAELPATATTYLEFIGRGVEQMRALVEGFLERVPGQEQARGLVSLSACLAAAKAAWQSQMDHTEAVIVSAELPTVLGKLRELTQMFRHLLAHTLTYGRPGSPLHIQIDCVALSHVWQISLQANGGGFPLRPAEVGGPLLNEDSPDRELDADFAWVKRLMEEHGGRFDAEAVPHQGVTFLLIFPRLLCHPDVEELMTRSLIA